LVPLVEVEVEVEVVEGVQAVKVFGLLALVDQPSPYDLVALELVP
jgi:hypothetical protein